MEDPLRDRSTQRLINDEHSINDERLPRSAKLFKSPHEGLMTFRFVILAGLVCIAATIKIALLQGPLYSGAFTRPLNRSFHPVETNIDFHSCNGIWSCVRLICDAMQYSKEINWVAIEPLNYDICNTPMEAFHNNVLLWITVGLFCLANVSLLLTLVTYLFPKDNCHESGIFYGCATGLLLAKLLLGCAYITLIIVIYSINDLPATSVQILDNLVYGAFAISLFFDAIVDFIRIRHRYLYE